ncbi:MAG: hypothetical protein AAGN82_06740 [Myxococcota bacterium]
MVGTTCPIVFKTRTPGYHFCGYYDVSPLDATGVRLLTHRVKEFMRMPKPDDVVELGWWDITTGHYQPIAETRAYNWQQGSKLQWLGPDFASRVIYNDREDGHFVARIVDVATGATRTLDTPIYTVHPNGRSAVCTNFERSYFSRPSYSYSGVVNRYWDVPLHPEDGLVRLDLETGARDQIISTLEMAEHQPLSSMSGAPHYLEHAMYNGDGSRFVFLHRWRLPSGATYDRAFTAADDGSGLHLLLDSGLFSHCGWRTPNELTAWATPPNLTGALRRSGRLTKTVLKRLLPLYRRLLSPQNRLRKAITGANYLHLTDRGGGRRVLAPGVAWPGDGHCTWNPVDRRWMITDSYEDEASFRWLLLYDHHEKKVREVARFFSPPRAAGTGFRCDLHPRWDRQGKRIIVDSMHEGDARQVYVLDVSEMLNDGA